MHSIIPSVLGCCCPHSVQKLEWDLVLVVLGTPDSDLFYGGMSVERNTWCWQKACRCFIHWRDCSGRVCPGHCLLGLFSAWLYRSSSLPWLCPPLILLLWPTPLFHPPTRDAISYPLLDSAGQEAFGGCFLHSWATLPSLPTTHKMWMAVGWPKGGNSLVFPQGERGCSVWRRVQRILRAPSST